MQAFQQQGVKRILLVFAVKNPSPLHPSYPLFYYKDYYYYYYYYLYKGNWEFRGTEG